MAALTECPDCGKQYRGKRCACGFTRLTSVPRDTAVTVAPEWLLKPPPCTPEQNEYAHNLVWAILAGEITTEQAHRVLNEIFLGRELEL